MATLLLDTSALLRRYVPAEPGSARLRAVCAPSVGNRLFVASVISVEVASALNRATREGRFSVTQRDRVWRLF